MNKEDFRILKEICGLHSKVESLRQKVNSERTRITKIEDLRLSARESLTEANSQLSEKSQELAQNEIRIEQLQKKIIQSQDALDKAVNEKAALSSQKQLEVFNENLAQEEEMAFKIMEEIESLETLKNDKNTFLAGSEKSLKDIQEEVGNNNAPTIKEIDITKERINLLNQDLDQATLLRLEKLLAKNLKHGPLTKIENSACYICGYSVNATDRDQIEKNLLLKTCGSCSRIFIPNTSLY